MATRDSFQKEINSLTIISSVTRKHPSNGGQLSIQYGTLGGMGRGGRGGLLNPSHPSLSHPSRAYEGKSGMRETWK